MRRRRLGKAAALVPLLAFACQERTFVVRSHAIPLDRPLLLNEPLVVELSLPVLEESVTAGTVEVVHQETGERVPGQVEVDGAELRFVAQVPRRADLSDCGLEPSGRYELRLPGLPRAHVLRSTSGRRLERGLRLRFSTVSALPGAPIRELFVDPDPSRAPALVRPRGGERVTWQVDLERLELLFSEPLDPRAFHSTRFRLVGPWSRDAAPEEDPELPAELVKNQNSALVALSVPEKLPMPWIERYEYRVSLPVGELRDLGGSPIAADQEPAIRVQVERAGE